MKNNDPINREKRLYEYHASVQARHALRMWYRTPLGNEVGSQEAQVLGELLSGLFGYHLIQLSDHGVSHYLKQSTIRHQVIMDYDSEQLECHVNMRGNSHQIPIASDSVDVVVLPHTLDIDFSPHLVLREVDRILVPEGKMLILGFNPWSSWGVRHLLNLWSESPPWSLRYISPFRVKDWLNLLGFEIDTVKTFFFRPPLAYPLVVRKLGFLDRIGQAIWPAFGSLYVLVANKKISTVTPIKPQWFLKQRSNVSTGVIETSTGGKI